MTIPIGCAKSLTTIRFEHEGRVGELLPIVLLNALLNILTLGFYRFWARTRVRRFLWGNTALLGDRFEYTGTGAELFKGFIFVLFAVLLPITVTNIIAEFYFADNDIIYGVYNLALLVAIWFLIGVAIYRARRFRLSRTRWRGVRAAQTGPAAAYGAQYLGFLFLNLLTLGWTYPLMRIRLMSRMINHTWFGDRKFEFSGSSGPLFKRFAIIWLGCAAAGGAIWLLYLLLPETHSFIRNPDSFAYADPENFHVYVFPIWMIVVAGLMAFVILPPIIFCAYTVKEFRYFAECTTFESARFKFNATVGAFLWLIVGNIVINLLTLGLGLPFTQMRVFRFVCDRLSAGGEIDIDAIIQNAEKRSGLGEGLADAFDVGAV